MGTDLFLYEAKSDVEKDNPIAHLRVNAWQERENALLRMVFDDKHWDITDVDERNYLRPKHYNFTEDGLKILAKLCKLLENSVIHGTEFQRHENPLVKIFEQQGNVLEQPGLDNRVATDFIESILAFYRKGISLKNPEVVIHW